MTLNGLAKGWGSNGIAMYVMAPWYSLRLSDSDLANFDPSVKMNMVVFRDDETNDHEMAIDVFENIAIPDANKAYLRVYSDTEQGCSLVADHNAPTSREELDGLDYWNWYHIDALLDYTFTGNATAWNIALGQGALPQTYWGTWWTGSEYERAKVLTDPLPSQASITYTFSCESSDNPRTSHCDWPTVDPN